ncbi:MAG: RNA methyltransferase, partial [Clostridia bacterium]|nr:RNA methyltransferase [Clostridia bacterium]
LDGIEDPYNFGQALRSLYAAGADGVILPARNWMTAAGTVCRASAGASELLPLFSASDGFFGTFRDAGYRIVTADAGGACIYGADLKKPLLLIIGGEKRGISAEVRKYSDLTVTIPYGRSFSASLPACSAATVIAFEIMRQNRG